MFAKTKNRIKDFFDSIFGFKRIVLAADRILNYIPYDGNDF